MVPGRPQPAERRVSVTPDERTHHLASTAGRMHRCRVGRRSDERVLVELAAAAPRHPTDVSNEHRRVDQFKLGECRCRRLDPRAAQPACPLERRLDRVDPLRRIRMLRQEHPRVVLAGRAVLEIQHRPHITPLSYPSHRDQHTSFSTATAAVRIPLRSTTRTVKPLRSFERARVLSRRLDYRAQLGVGFASLLRSPRPHRVRAPP